jgi:hypothetical protein
MTTLEDIYHPYERNRWFYAEKDESLVVRPLDIVGDISGHEISKVKKLLLTLKNKWEYAKFPKTVKENLKIKHYIKIGEECPLCYEPIWHKKNAFLTDCGHAFHSSCIHSYEMANIYNDYAIFCPMCRCDMGLYGENGYIYISSENRLDKLEDFWNNISYETPRVCCKNHILGLNKNCKKCVNYRRGND